MLRLPTLRAVVCMMLASGLTATAHAADVRPSASWVNPRAAVPPRPLGVVVGSGATAWESPSAPDAEDWVLLGERLVAR